MADPVVTQLPVSLERQIACVAREIALRRNVYPKFVASGKIKQETADTELAAMEAVLATLKRWVKVRSKLHVSDHGSLHIELNGVQLSGPTGRSIFGGPGVDKAIDESPLWR